MVVDLALGPTHAAVTSSLFDQNRIRTDAPRSPVTHDDRVLGTITAGIFTGKLSSPDTTQLAPLLTCTPGLAASAPLYTLPSLLNRTPYDRARPASDLEKFEDVNKAAASSLNLAGISGAAFLVAAYAAPKEVAYNPKFLGRGASEIGTRFPSDRVCTLITSGLILLIPFSTLIVGPIAKSIINMRTKLQAEQIAGTGAGVPNKGQDEFNKQLKKWSIATEVVALLGLVATVSGSLQLVGVGL
ncbi:hypothetical protein AG1IA_02744 [Rhizoctonia solani AG-1 IA]|uniref:Uncharacterized protein n=1 Tax=Thanatephorus cucumeris (strain AG1-IA) TaxID=983506 RepID=L8X3M8_THACA|nr:hypothetical protein AG1IA_02744 [Rhizoctonia solani AG-1 IA]